jgi:sterol desaturase/sphingolipid hydroxylase (fatty acid hydroxylase superfamily)
MNMFIIDYDVMIRLGYFFLFFIFLSLWEIAAPRRKLKFPRSIRWVHNIAIAILNSFVVRAVFPAAAVGTAFVGELNAWGLFNMLPIPTLSAGILTIILLDLTIYTQHYVFHKVPALWRLHRMHHTDTDLDITTGTRFHTIEIVASIVIRISVVVNLGAPVWAVLFFEILLNATSMFNHSNIKMPATVDRILRKIVVTPDMHRVHHSVLADEYNSNFGFNSPWWDRLFGTYRAQPARGHDGMNIGLMYFRDPKYLRLPWLLAIPFLKQTKLL